MRKTFRILSFIFFFGCLGIMSLIVFGYSHIPNEISLQQFDSMSSGTAFVCRELDNVSTSAAIKSEEKYETSVMLFNLFPVKNAQVAVSERKYVVPGGGIFGIRLYTKGVMVVKIEGVKTQKGVVNPGALAGLREGDMILSVDRNEITDNASLSRYISSSEGRILKFVIERNGREIQVDFRPVKADDLSYKGGLWIRDSTAGIGTMTYYDRDSGVFAGLGHAICDVDTGETMPLLGGDAVDATVKGCYKGHDGTPGELCGVFNSQTLGELYINGETGIFGTLNQTDRKAQTIPVALPSEITEGKAQIISTVDENEPHYYDIEITKIYKNDTDERNMIIKITDSELIEKTGGIVQGMSGSPIIQNGKLAGAVTHVFVDNAKEGYGIFAENMIETQQQLEESLKNAEAG